MNNIKLGLKGFIIGIANIIPGVSGGTLAITLGLYERLIGILSNFTKNIKENIKFLIPIILGAGLSLLLGAKVISLALNNYEVITILFFIGLILGGVPMLFSNIKKGKRKLVNYLSFFIPFVIVLTFTFMSNTNTNINLTNINLFGYIKLLIVGIIAAATMVIPGVSGSFVLMLIGYYEPIISVISNLTKFNNILSNIIILIPFGIGVLIGIVGIAKIIEYFLKKYKTATYYAIIGFVLSSVIAIFKPLIGINVNGFDIIFGIIMLIVGFLIAYKLGKK